ncbi:MAG TPA: ATP-binding protein [Planctomycetaceae bacterium]|nr:ATP-binding protein [Planctomycetaceae bacterium]
MAESRTLLRIVFPTLAVSVTLGGLSLLAGVALATGNLFPPTPTARLFVGAGVLLGCSVAVGGLVLAYQMGCTFQRSFEDVRQRVHAAAQRLGCEVSHSSQSPQDFVEQVRLLLEGVDRVIQERQQSEREVLRADQLAMVGQIAAGVAHELRNPLTSIKLLIQTYLREAAQQEPADHDLEVIDHEIRRMEKCLQQFLDFARPPRPERRPINLVLLIERTLALVEGRARKQQVKLHFDPVSGPVMVEADEDQIQQLLVNLVLNALDAMPDGGRIEIELATPKDHQVELQVRDNGPGIPDALFPRLFDPFVSTKETGIGLGLAVSHRIAARHGGNLAAENCQAGGACFTLRLPFSPPLASSNDPHPR